MTELSVVICTYNPNRELLQEAIDAIAPQLAQDAAELVIIDNNSSPPISLDELRIPLTDISIHREVRQGLLHARMRGIKEAKGTIITFVDDDNILAKDYLEECYKAFSTHQNLGVIAGRSTGRFERRPNFLVEPHIARYAIRDLGDEMIICTGDRWALGEPFGAGMAVRRDVCIAFVTFVEQTQSLTRLGRQGNSLASGEDSLFSRIAFKLGYQVAYIPSLAIEHVIPKERLELRYLLRLLKDQAASHVILERLCGRIEPHPKRNIWFMIAVRFLMRAKHIGPLQAFIFAWWDLGYFQEVSATQE